MSPIVVDASAAVEHVVGTPLGESVASVLRAPGSDLHAPAVCDAEVGVALRRLVLRRDLAPNAGKAALLDHRDLPIVRHPHAPLLARAFALRENFGFADALYVALAEALQARVLTADRRLARAIEAHARVELLTA